MNNDFVSNFQDFQNILVICPHCGEIHRLSEMNIYYKGKIKKTWVDTLRAKEEKIGHMEDLLDEKRDAIKAAAQERGKRQLPRLLRRSLPTICARGYFPQDLKVLFDPIDFVIFDGMNLKGKVKQVVLLDGPAHDKRHEKIQISIKQVVRKGNYEWMTVKLDDTGKIQ